MLSRSDACTDEPVSRFLSTNRFRRLGNQLYMSFNCLCVAEEFREDDSWIHLRRDEILELSVCHCLDDGRFRDRTGCTSRCLVSHVGTAAALAFITCRRPSSRMWSMVRHHGQEQILWVSKVRVTVNDGINDLFEFRAEVS